MRVSLPNSDELTSHLRVDIGTSAIRFGAWMSPSRGLQRFSSMVSAPPYTLRTCPQQVFAQTLASSGRLTASLEVRTAAFIASACRYERIHPIQ